MCSAVELHHFPLTKANTVPVLLLIAETVGAQHLLQQRHPAIALGTDRPFSDVPPARKQD